MHGELWWAAKLCLLSCGHLDICFALAAASVHLPQVMLQVLAAPCRIEELSKMLNQQYDVAAELKRNLEAEAALHTRNVSFTTPNYHLCLSLTFL